MTTTNMVTQEKHGERTAREKRRGGSNIEEVQVEVEATTDILRTKDHCLPAGARRSEGGIGEIGRL